MKCLDLTLPNAAANLAFDEALLDACEENPRAETLRFWEPQNYFVVVGYGNCVATEVNTQACHAENTGIYRRCSGGGTVLQGPGCLNYSLVFSVEANPALHSITAANCHIMQRHREVLTQILRRPVSVNGITDLSIGGLKFSGNAQRRKRNALIFHGTFLLNFDLGRVERFLKPPSRQPDYRKNRTHAMFLTNLGVPAATVKAALRKSWSADEVFEGAPEIPDSLQVKYSSREWIWR